MFEGAVYIGTPEVTEIITSTFGFLPEYSEEFEVLRESKNVQEEFIRSEALIRRTGRAVIIEQFEGSYAVLVFIDPRTNKVETKSVTFRFVETEIKL